MENPEIRAGADAEVQGARLSGAAGVTANSMNQPANQQAHLLSLTLCNLDSIATGRGDR